jgi:hypothetical protein
MGRANRPFRRSRLRRRLLAVGLPAGFAVGCSCLLAFGVTGSLQGFSASITNSAGSYAAGTLLLSETQGANTCISTGTNTTSSNSVSAADANATCTSINLLGTQTAADPGISASTGTVTVKNIGTIAASSLTLTPGGCTAAANSATSPYSGTDTSGYCGKVDVTIFNGTNCVYPAQSGACPTPSSTYTLSTLGTTARSLGALASAASTTYTFTLALDSSATNADQGLAASESFAWNLIQ